MLARARRHFWFAIMELADRGGSAMRRLYLYAVGRASNATDWGVSDSKTPRGEEPF